MMVTGRIRASSKMKAYVLSTLVFIVGWYLLLAFYVGGGEIKVEALMWAMLLWVIPFFAPFSTPPFGVISFLVSLVLHYCVRSLSVRLVLPPLVVVTMIGVVQYGGLVPPFVSGIRETWVMGFLRNLQRGSFMQEVLLAYACLMSLHQYLLPHRVKTTDATEHPRSTDPSPPV